MSLALSDQKSQRCFGAPCSCAAVEKRGEENKSKLLAEQCFDNSGIMLCGGIRPGLNATTLWAHMQ